MGHINSKQYKLLKRELVDATSVCLGAGQKQDESRSINALKKNAVGLQNGRISDKQLSCWIKTVDQNYTESFPYFPRQGRLHNRAPSAAPGYLQIDLNVDYWIVGVATQGNGGDDNKKQWTKSFQIQVMSEIGENRLRLSSDMSSDSVDEESKSIRSGWQTGGNWINVKNGENDVFQGNSDSASVKEVLFDAPVKSRYLRFVPLKWHGAPCLRVEVYVAFRTMTEYIDNAIMAAAAHGKRRGSTVSEALQAQSMVTSRVASAEETVNSVIRAATSVLSKVNAFTNRTEESKESKTKSTLQRHASVESVDEITKMLISIEDTIAMHTSATRAAAPFLGEIHEIMCRAASQRKRLQHALDNLRIHHRAEADALAKKQAEQAAEEARMKAEEEKRLEEERKQREYEETKLLVKEKCKSLSKILQKSREHLRNDSFEEDNVLLLRKYIAQTEDFIASIKFAADSISEVGFDISYKATDKYDTEENFKKLIRHLQHEVEESKKVSVQLVSLQNKLEFSLAKISSRSAALAATLASECAFKTAQTAIKEYNSVRLQIAMQVARRTILDGVDPEASYPPKRTSEDIEEKDQNQMNKFSVQSEQWTKIMHKVKHKVIMDLGREKTNKLFEKSGTWRYDIAGKPVAYYVRTNGKWKNFDAYHYMTEVWESKDNTMHKDYEIYSTEADLNGRLNPWTWANYDDFGNKIGFPRDSGPKHAIGSRWFSRKLKSRSDQAFFVKTKRETNVSTPPPINGIYEWCDPEKKRKEPIQYRLISHDGVKFTADYLGKEEEIRNAISKFVSVRTGEKTLHFKYPEWDVVGTFESKKGPIIFTNTKTNIEGGRFVLKQQLGFVVEQIKDECPICLEVPSVANAAVGLNCRHIYHRQCLLQIRKKDSWKCGICNADIVALRTVSCSRRRGAPGVRNELIAAWNNAKETDVSSVNVAVIKKLDTELRSLQLISATIAMNFSSLRVLSKVAAGVISEFSQALSADDYKGASQQCIDAVQQGSEMPDFESDEHSKLLNTVREAPNALRLLREKVIDGIASELVVVLERILHMKISFAERILKEAKSYLEASNVSTTETFKDMKACAQTLSKLLSNCVLRTEFRSLTPKEKWKVSRNRLAMILQMKTTSNEESKNEDFHVKTIFSNWFLPPEIDISHLHKMDRVNTFCKSRSGSDSVSKANCKTTWCYCDKSDRNTLWPNGF
eukprot:g4669.t1